MQTYEISHENKPVQLSFVRPDFDSLKQQFIAVLGQYDSWIPIIQSGGGETILEFLCSIGAYAQFGNMRAAQETMLDSARMGSSVYTIARHLGVHIQRKLPAQVLVQLTNSAVDYIMVPRFSQFSVGGLDFFNRDILYFTPDIPTIQATLYQGTITVFPITSIGQIFQIYEIGNEDFTISDSDIYCFDDEYNTYVKITDGLWHYPGPQLVFFENSSSLGNVQVRFGNGIYGNVPSANTVLNIVYASVIGSEANTSTSSLSVIVNSVCNVVPEHFTGTDQSIADQVDHVLQKITGETISEISGGTEEPGKDFYKIMAPFINSAKDRAVRPQDHYALAFKFPGLGDVYFQGQRQLAPKNRNYINVVGVTALMQDGSLMTDATWNNFVDYLHSISIWRLEYIRIDPTPVRVDIEGSIYVLPDSDVPKLNTRAQYLIRNKFAVRPGALGYSLYKTDITNIMVSSHHSLKPDFAELRNPGTDIIITSTQFIIIGNIYFDIRFSSRNYFGFVPQARLPTS